MPSKSRKLSRLIKPENYLDSHRYQSLLRSLAKDSAVSNVNAIKVLKKIFFILPSVNLI